MCGVYKREVVFIGCCEKGGCLCCFYLSYKRWFVQKVCVTKESCVKGCCSKQSCINVILSRQAANRI